MGAFVCGKFLDKYLLANRSRPIGMTIDENLFSQLRQIFIDGSDMPEWATMLVGKIGYDAPDALKHRLDEVIYVRNQGSFSFGKASYEITERCNYDCRHCYLGKKSQGELPLLKKLEVLRMIQESGALWLQITGGEPLASKDFVPVYRFAYELGFLVTVSTNGSLLTRPIIQEMLTSHPPYRVTVSVYGATDASYEALTQTPGSFRKFLGGLHWLREHSIQARLNIIVTSFNESELEAMKMIAQKFGFEYHVFPKLSPSLDGESYPLELTAESCRTLIASKSVTGTKSGHSANRCSAGRDFFHVNAVGKASICKIAREPNVDLISDGLDGLRRLPAIADRLLLPATICTTCELRNSCLTCTPKLALSRKSGVVPFYVCREIYSRKLLDERSETHA